MFPAGAMEEMMKNTTPEQQKMGMEEWQKWVDEHKDSFADTGGGLGKNTRITKEGSTDMKNEMGGYSIMQANSKEEAVKLLEGSPHFEMGAGAYVELMEIMGM